MTWEDFKSKVSADTYATVYDDIVDKEHQTQFYTFPSGFVFILRSLVILSEELGYKTEHFVYLENKVWLYSYENKSFDEFANNMDDFLDVVYERFENNKNILLLYTNELEKMEDSIFDRKIQAGFMDNWFDLKKDISRIERFFTRQLFAYKDLSKFGDKQDGFPSLDFNNMIADIQFALTTSEGVAARLDNLQNYYNSVKDDKLNKNIYFLTVLSGIFLPLNLIVGFFGMNTEGMIFKENAQGTMFVIYILVGILFLFFIGFNLIKIVDRLFLRWWLGRSNIYKQFSTRVEKLEEKWRV